MSYAKFLISSAIFVVLTVVKLIMPSISDDISREIKSVLITEAEQTTTVMELGAKITDGRIFEAFESCEDNKIIPIKEIINYNNILPMPTKAVEETEAEEPDNPKLEAFLNSQDEFSEYDVPENVSYEMPMLPFEYTNPIAGSLPTGFGYRMHPIKNEVLYHYGTDFAANTGDEILAFADGVIRATGENDSYGKYIIIDHAEGYSTLYAHCSQIYISSGSVSKGELIARVGSSGSATGPHLHFELLRDSVYLNPEFYV